MASRRLVPVPNPRCSGQQGWPSAIPVALNFERYDLHRVCVFILPGQKADACTGGSFTGKAVDAARQETDRYFVWTSH